MVGWIFTTILCRGLHLVTAIQQQRKTIEKNPTNDNVVRYYLSRVAKEHHVKKITIRQLAEFVRGIWEKGYGCPLSTNAIVTKFEKLFQIYQTYRKGEGRGVQQAIWSQEKKD